MEANLPDFLNLEGLSFYVIISYSMIQMNNFWEKRKSNLLIIAVIVFVSILVLLSGLLDGLELKSLDARAKLKKGRSLDFRIVLITIGVKPLKSWADGRLLGTTTPISFTS